MTLVSNAFWLFVFAAVLVYYLMPGRLQWIVLLIFSYAYYLAGGVKYVVFLLFSTVVTFVFALLIEKSAGEAEESKTPKRLLAAGLVLNFGMLGILKYTGFVVSNFGMLFRIQTPAIRFLLPLGISFYTFQSSGYLIDVYWKRAKAQKNPLRYALFVSFFPQLLQGPIAIYDQLAPQLQASHSFDGKRTVRALERILWGLAKKIVIADWAAVFVDAISANPDRYSGVVGICLLLYYVELYMDFSGAMDVVIGIGSLFGIEMQENFRQPYLAVSLQNFWQRWHITLGEWMKRYVFYTISMSSLGMKLQKWGKKKFGRRNGNSVQIAYSTLIVFLLVGIWHGASWVCVCFGLFNGLVMGISELLKGSYAKWKKVLHISDSSKGYILFMILRTQFLFVIQSIFDCSDTVRGSMHLLGLTFTRFDLSLLLTIPAGREGIPFAPAALAIITAGTILVIVIGCLREKGIDIREKIAALPAPVTAGIYLALLLTIGFCGCTAAPKGFIYAQF